MGGKKKRKETILSSSSFRSSSYRQDSVSPATSTACPNNHVKTVNVGCMSGIFQLMSKYHTRRKFLTFGRKQERNTVVQATTPSPREKIAPPLPKPECTTTRQPRDQGSSAGRLSLDQTPRSPVVPAEIRRSSTDSSSRVVARLMGLDDIPATPPSPASAPASVTEVSPAAEKRRKLLGALEKCDNDLKALKKIIEAVRATQTPPRAVAMKRREEVEEGESEVGSDEPSPVSVLDHHYLSFTYSKRTQNEQLMQQQQQKPKQQKQQITRKKPGDHEDKAINFLNKPTFSILVTSTPQQLQPPARSSESVLYTTATTSAAANAMVLGAPWSTAMKESVIQVCRDVEFGQIQEVGCIGLLLQDCLLRELIEDIIKELGSYNVHVHSTSSFNLSYEAYKRKLFF